MLKFYIFYIGVVVAILHANGSAAQVITTVAGNGTAIFSGDGGPATAAGFGLIDALAIVTDSANNLYITDYTRIRKVDAAGIITTIAGNGTYSYSGDGGPATAAGIISLLGLAIDEKGDIYYNDNASRIRKISTSGIISSIAGTGVIGYTGDGGPATNAELKTPYLASDRYGNLYFSDSAFIRKVDTAGIITTIAGTGSLTFSGDGGPASAAGMSPRGITLDTAGNIYFSDRDNYRIRKIDVSGTVTTVGGTGFGGFSGDGGLATNATFNLLQGLFVDEENNIYLTDNFNYRVRRIDAAGIITTIAGNGTAGYSGDGGPATAAGIDQVTSVCRNGNGNIYLMDSHNNVMRMLSALPYFTNGHSQYHTFCQGISMTLDTLLAASDAYSEVKLHWSILSGPHHGTAAVVYTALSTGNTVYPAGLTYTSALGFTGADTLTVRLTDSISSDTTVIYMNVIPPPHTGNLTGPDSVCIADSAAYTDTTAGGIWSLTNAHAFITAGIVHGVSAGQDTIRYIVPTVCGADTVTHKVYVKNCAANIYGFTAPGTAIEIYPNPCNGTFNITVPSAYNEQEVIIITNMLGQKTDELHLATNQRQTIHLSAPAGIYFLNGVSTHDTWSKRIILSGGD